MTGSEFQEDSSSLSGLFNRAKSNQETLDTLDPRSDDFKSLLQSTISTLQQCSRLIDQLSLFSPNESLDDISTSDIQYLSVDYLHSEFILRSYSPDSRREQLNQASELLESFLQRLDEYDLLKTSGKKLLEAFKESRSTFRIINETAGLETKRNMKIKRFQEEKVIKQRLKFLRDQSASLNVDDEVLRSLNLAELDLYVHQAFANLDNISQERDLLKMMPVQLVTAATNGNAWQNDTRQNGRRTDEYSERLDPSSLLDASRPHKGILDNSGRPLQPFTVTNKRTDLRKGVFRPGHSLPTMSIDEYLEEEHKRGGIISGGGPQSEVVVQPDEDDIKAQDEATVKAREWDNFVEANPKGAGNSLNRG